MPLTSADVLSNVLYDFVDAYDRAFEAAAANQRLSVAQACVLIRLDEKRGMSSLAVELGCDASNITQIVARLESRGLVTREPSPTDGRARLIVRTPDGDVTKTRFEAAFEFARDVTERLSADECEQLTSLLHKAMGA